MSTMNNVSLSIQRVPILRDVSLEIETGTTCGLIGRNGAGKTTLTKILAGEGQPSGGRVDRRGDVGYLPQDPRTGDLEVRGRDRILSVRGLDVIAARMAKAEADMSSEDPTVMEKAVTRYPRLEDEFRAAGGYAADAEASQIAASLGLPSATLDQPIGTMSGGQRRRVELARILFSGAPTLLLDEPTNHLDGDSIVWLREFLRTYAGGLLVISHDADLLRACVNRIMYIDANRGEVDQYTLGWDAYLRQREEDERRRRKERANVEKKAEALMAQANRMRAKASKASAAQSMLARAASMVENLEEVRVSDKVAALRFPTPAPCGKTPLRAHELSKSFGSLEVFTDADLAIDKGSKVVVLGLNGAGKTTLLRILAGVDEADTGTVEAGHGLRLGYYAQEHETLDTSLTVDENMRHAAPELDDARRRTILGSFLFSGDDVHKPAGVLSGGEKTRLALATLVASQANVLLLDEPTNNLDPASREEILSALRGYEGAVVLVTHDPGAVDALEPDRVLLLPDAVEDLWNDSYRDLISLA